MAGSGSQTNLNESVELSFRGRTKFKGKGPDSRQLGRERSSQNPADMIRTFPENLTTPAGDRAFPEWSGGILGVLSRPMEDFNTFHDQWHLDDLGDGSWNHSTQILLVTNHWFRSCDCSLELLTEVASHSLRSHKLEKLCHPATLRHKRKVNTARRVSLLIAGRVGYGLVYGN